MNLIESAERAVLAALFRAYPRTFVWIGGSVLQLLYGSPRASYDLDLAAGDEAPPADPLARVAGEALAEVNQVLHSRCRIAKVAGAAPVRLAVLDRDERLFLIDCTRIAGHLGETMAVVIDSLVGPQSVAVPTEASLLALKLEALLLRRFLKPSDAFDVWFLLSLGVTLEDQHREWLSEHVRLREIEWTDVAQRLAKLTAHRFLADLQKHVSPEALHSWTPDRAQAALSQVRALLQTEIRWR